MKTISKSIIIVYMLFSIVNVHAQNTSDCIVGDCENGFGVLYLKGAKKTIRSFFKDGKQSFASNVLEDKIHANIIKFYDTNGRVILSIISRPKSIQIDNNIKGQSLLYNPSNNIKRLTYYKEPFSNIVVKTDNAVSASDMKGCNYGNCVNGFGEKKYDNGDRYIGTFKNGLIEGFGIYFMHEGYIYMGEYENGQFHGKGVYIVKTNTYQMGEFKKGRPEGKSVYQSSRFRFEAGVFKNNKIVKTITKSKGIKL